MVITVKISSEKKQTDSNRPSLRIALPDEVNLDEYVQISIDFLNFLHRSWVKVANSKKILSVTGGFVVKCQDDSVFLRVPASKDTFQIKFEDTTLFYIKRDDENYMSIVALKIQQSKEEHLMLEKKASIARKEAYLEVKLKELGILQKTLEKKLARS